MRSDYSLALLQELERVKRDRDAARDAHRALLNERSAGFTTG